MKKIVVSLTIALLIVFTVLPAYAAQPVDNTANQSNIAPRLLTGVSASLSKTESGSQLKVFSSVICNDSSERIYLSVYLQRYRNGSWETYSIYTAQGTGDCVIAKYATPPRGYNYRIYAIASNSSLTTKYSSSVYF